MYAIRSYYVLDQQNRIDFNDTRWANNIASIQAFYSSKFFDLNDVYQKYTSKNISVDIHYANNLELDVKHVEHLSSPFINKYAYETDSHYVSKYLKESNLLDQIIEEAVNEVVITSYSIHYTKLYDCHCHEQHRDGNVFVT